MKLPPRNVTISPTPASVYVRADGKWGFAVYLPNLKLWHSAHSYETEADARQNMDTAIRLVVEAQQTK